VIEQILIALLAGRAIASSRARRASRKTLLVKSIAQVFSPEVSRIQFTPDLMGRRTSRAPRYCRTTVPGGRRLTFVRGPVFAT